MTVKQQQHLLAYLGYYVGDIDGKFGMLSKTACKAFQADFGGISSDGIVGIETEKALKHAVAYGMPKKEDANDFWSRVNYFDRSEFKCKCGKCGGFPVEPSEELVLILDNIRKYFGKPVFINSGIRCATHNANVGGAMQSQHLKGTAADIVVEDVVPERVAMYAETLLPKTGGIGRYKTFTHVDVRSVKARWNG
jgi:hypothetical protein